MALQLYGFKFSVYSWIARLALHEKELAYEWIEVNPFVDPLPEGYASLHPFGRVPVLRHDASVIYETVAITRYIDENFAGPSLQDDSPSARARTSQIISIVDNYAYWPLVRQVFSHDVFRPALGRSGDASEIDRGMAAAPCVLDALENLASGERHLISDRFTLADIHLAPMLIYFAMSPRGSELLSSYPKLWRWMGRTRDRPTVRKTIPVFG